MANTATRLTAPLTHTPCIAYKIRVYTASTSDDDPDEEHIRDSDHTEWQINDGTGLAGVVPGRNPCDPQETFGDTHLRIHSSWPGLEGSEGNTLTPTYLERVVSRFGSNDLPSGDPTDVSWDETILREYGSEQVFAFGPCVVLTDSIQFGSDALLWHGTRAEALSLLETKARRGVLWITMWMAAFALSAGGYLLLLPD